MAPLSPPLETTTAGDLPHAIIKLQNVFRRWEHVALNTREDLHLTKELLTSCESIEKNVDELEKVISVASSDPAYYGRDEAALKWTGSARNLIGTVRSAVEKGKRISAVARHQGLIGTSRNYHCSSQDNHDYVDIESDRNLLLMRQQDDEIDDLIVSAQRIAGVELITQEELSGQDPLLSQENDPDLSNLPCTPLDKKKTIEAMRIVSFAVLTMISVLSSYSAETLAPLARQHFMRELLLISPYVCITVALIGVALSLCASESNGLADYAAMAILLVCLYGIGLGTSAAVFVLKAAHRSTGFRWTVFCTFVLVIGLICSWGWLFTYPQCLKFNMRMIYWSCFGRQRSTDPWPAAYADPESAQHKDQKGFFGVISNFVAVCLRAFHPLDEDMTIAIMKSLSPSVLTGISGLSLWVAHTIAPQAHTLAMYRFLITLPYGYLPLCVVAITLSAASSRSNGLASCASLLNLVLCVYGVLLGACCSFVVRRSGIIWTLLVAFALVFVLVSAWGWMFAYPKDLHFAMRSLCTYCAQCGSWAWIFALLKVLGLNVAHFSSGCFDLCVRTAQGWWTAGCALSARGELDLEVGAGGLELTPLAVSRSEDAEG